MSYPQRWFKNSLTSDQKKELEDALKHSKLVLDRLVEILEEDIETSYRKSRDEGNFLKPAWSEHQAYLLGEQKNIMALLTLLNRK